LQSITGSQAVPFHITLTTVQEKQQHWDDGFVDDDRLRRLRLFGRQMRTEIDCIIIIIIIIIIITVTNSIT